MTNKCFLLKKFFLIIFFNFLFISAAVSQIIKEINIVGNKRISSETIIMFSGLNLGDENNSKNLNKALKDLYYTDYFKNVFITGENGVIIITVDENPIIQSVKINGIDKDRINEKLREVTNKIEKYPFVENKINDQISLIKNILKSNGYYFVELKASTKQYDNNTVDIIYDIDLGNIAKIKKISFIGNKIYRDNSLRNVIISEENKFWKFITPNKFLDSERIKIDVQRLKNYYKNRGFFNVQIKSTTAIINDENQFELVFNIDAGKKFKFNEIKIINNNILLKENVNFFQKKLDKLKGKNYSIKTIQTHIDDLNEFILQNDFVFINAKYDHVIKDENKIDILINFDDLDKEYVDRINIFGNFITDEKVIRNNLIIDEGDAFNDLLFKKSIQKVKSLNIFKSVDYKSSNNDNLSKIIDITVEEKPTGEIFAGAGTGTTGSNFSAGVKENNYLGLGIKLDTNFTVSDDSILGKFTVSNPNFKNSDKAINTTIESSADDFMSTSGYKTERTGFVIGTEFEQMNNLFVNLQLSNYYEDLETSSTANAVVRKQEGNYFENLLTYSLIYNRLDQDYQPTDGFINNFSQTLPLYSDDLSLENTFTSSVYHSLSDSLILSANLFLKSINSFEDNVRVSKRVYVPSRRLRGFESGKIGPKDGSQYIGGNYASALNLNSTLPSIIFENDNLDLNFFIDLANVWKVDYNSSLDSNKIRSSTGIAVNWYSAICPLTLSYAVPLSEEDTDITEKFRFQIGTSF